MQGSRYFNEETKKTRWHVLPDLTLLITLQATQMYVIFREYARRSLESVRLSISTGFSQIFVDGQVASKRCAVPQWGPEMKAVSQSGETEQSF